MVGWGSKNNFGIIKSYVCMWVGRFVFVRSCEREEREMHILEKFKKKREPDEHNGFCVQTSRDFMSISAEIMQKKIYIYIYV